MGSLSKSYVSFLVFLVLISSMIVTSCFPIAIAKNTPSDFAISINASINNCSTTCIFGVNSNSSISYNAKYDLLEPYKESGIRAYIYYSNQTALLTQALSQYIVPSNGSTIWRLGITSIDQTGLVTLTWNNTSVKSMFLEDALFGKICANMNEVNNYSFNITSGVDALFRIVYESTITETATPSPNVPELSWMVILPFLLSIFSFAVVLRHRKTADLNQ
jgi:hypothetical protein